jgi:eukaryotic-like serine/threonine-protein kinase
VTGLEPTADVRIIGRYALHHEIAAGGMATVHLGRLLGPAGFSRTVAIKRLHAQYAKDPEFVSMFLDEARVAARIRHPNVVSTLDVVALEGELFIVMDYVEGESLSRLVRQARAKGERVPTNVALSIMTHVLYGLHSAHSAKGERGEALDIVHRDVSPQNILIDTEGIVRVVDFGVAKAVGRLQTTRDGQLKGKLSYMAPEQLRGAKVDARTDVFAASVVLWELLTGQRLFQGDNEAATFGMILECKVRAPSAEGAEISPEIEEILLRGLAAEPEKRHETALDMAEALEHATLQRPTQRVIGRWVRELAVDTLKRRAEAVRELESHSAVNELIRTPDGLASRPSNPALEPVAVAAAPAPEPVAAAPEPAVVPVISAPSPAVPADDDDDLPTRLSDSRSDAARPRPVVAAAAVATPPVEEKSASSQVSSISLERMKTTPPPPATQRRKRVAALAGVAGGLAIALAVAAGLLFGGRHHAEQATGPASAGAPVSAVVPTSSAPAPVAVVENASAAESPSAPPSASSAPAPKPAPTPKAVSHPPRAPVTKKTTPKHEVKPGCNPPYTLDKDGTRIPKLECL